MAREPGTGLTNFLWGLLLVATIAISGYLAFNYFTFKKIVEYPFAQSAQSNAKGTIKVVEFLDYSCPYCHQMFHTLKQATAGQADINIIIRPVALLSEDSAAIASFVIAAGEQGKAYAFHEALMSQKTPPRIDMLMPIAKNLNLDLEKLKNDVQSDKTLDTLKINAALHKHYNLRSVPALLINGKKFSPEGGMPSGDSLLKTIRNF